MTVTLSNGSVITIEAGKTTGTVTVAAPADDVYKDAGKVEVTIKDASGGNFENLVPSTVPLPSMAARGTWTPWTTRPRLPVSTSTSATTRQAEQASVATRKAIP
ncbi:immunoglobulin-like domain-containing protein [Pseudomonas sp. HS6]|uniref:immunoglobulin-like domain-containing protein n=1 Tax=Pseudomonas sp. HS6 TaxID=2850559 RepID=UPI0034A16D04